jgi:hypothetical protein
MRRALAIAVAALLAGCADWPDLGDRIEGDAGPAAAGYPDLVPIDTILASAVPSEETADGEARAVADLEARAERLRLRAAILAMPAGDTEALDRMRARLAALGG